MVDKRLSGTQELPPSKEAALEILPELEINQPVQEKPAPVAVQPVSAAAAAPSPVLKSPLAQNIEIALEENLDELYLSMPSALQSEFKHKGEETASKIIAIIKKGKDVAKKVFEAIVEWLKLIPGVNKFFLEQEAKIKTDKIINLKK